MFNKEFVEALADHFRREGRLFDGVIASGTPLSFLWPAAIEPVGYERNPVPSVF